MRCKAGSSSTTRTHTWRSPLLRRFRSLSDVAPMPLAPTLMRPAATPVSGWVLACFLLVLVCLNAGSPATAQLQSPQARAGLEPITPIPAMPPQDARRLVLGERLFSDPRLSHDDTRSCSSCHDVRTNGASANAHGFQCKSKFPPELGREFPLTRRPCQADA